MLTTLELGAAALVVAGVLAWLRILPKLRAVLAFIGVCIVTGGLFGSFLARAAGWVESWSNTTTGKIFGVALPGIIVIVLGIVLLYDLHPKHGASKRTMWIAGALAAFLVAGISTFPALNHIPANVRSGVTTTVSGH